MAYDGGGICIFCYGEKFYKHFQWHFFMLVVKLDSFLNLAGNICFFVNVMSNRSSLLAEQVTG